MPHPSLPSNTRLADVARPQDGADLLAPHEGVFSFCYWVMIDRTRRMELVSWHSTRKVLSPAMMWSRAPSRVKMQSAGDRMQEAAATRHPICGAAMYTQHDVKSVQP